MLHHERAVAVGESVGRSTTGEWLRAYRIRLQLQDPKKIKKAFGVEFDEIKVRPLARLEMRRVSGGAVTSRHTNSPVCFRPSSTAGNSNLSFSTSFRWNSGARGKNTAARKR